MQTYGQYHYYVIEFIKPLVSKHKINFLPHMGVCEECPKELVRELNICASDITHVSLRHEISFFRN